MGAERLDMHRPIPSRAHDLRQSLRIVRIGLVDLHFERRPRMPGVKACDFEPPAAQFVHQPWRHGTGLDADTRILFGMPTYHPLDLFGVRCALTTPKPATGAVNDADRRQLLRHVQTNVVGHRTASDGESHRATSPGSRHYRRINRLPRLPDVHIRDWGYDDTGGTIGRVDSRPGERGCDGCC